MQCEFKNPCNANTQRKVQLQIQKKIAIGRNRKEGKFKIAIKYK
jgi:hypothetical protein